MKHLLKHYGVLCMLSLAHVSAQAQTIMRLTIVHTATDHIWQEDVINQLQSTIESVAPSLLEAKLLHVEHSCEGNKVTFDINQRETRNVRDKFNSLLNGIKKISAIVSNRLGNAVAQVMNIPYDVLIYYNPATQAVQNVVAAAGTLPVDIAQPADLAENVLSGITDQTGAVIAIIQPASRDSLASSVSTVIEALNNGGTPVVQEITNSIADLTGDTLDTNQIVPVIVDITAYPVVAIEETFIHPILDVNNTVDDIVLDTVNTIGNPIVNQNIPSITGMTGIPSITGITGVPSITGITGATGITGIPSLPVPGNNVNQAATPNTAPVAATQPISAVIAVVTPAVASTPVAQIPGVSTAVTTIQNALNSATNPASGSNNPVNHLVGGLL